MQTKNPGRDPSVARKARASRGASTRVRAQQRRARRAPSRATRPSAKDVARLAGVSTATVSRAINLPDAVDADTRASVRDAVAKLRYVPHGAARALRSQRSQMVGAVVPSVDYALYARTTSALQAVLDARDIRWCWPSTTTTSTPRCASPSSS